MMKMHFYNNYNKLREDMNYVTHLVKDIRH